MVDELHCLPKDLCAQSSDLVDVDGVGAITDDRQIKEKLRVCLHQRPEYIVKCDIQGGKRRRKEPLIGPSGSVCCSLYTPF